MSRARDLSNLGSQAGSGLDASDITSGILPVGVIGGSGLNAVNPANLASGALPLGVTGGSGLNAVSAGNLATGVLPSTVTGGTGLAVSTAATTTFAPKASPAFTGTPTGITAAHLEAGELPSDVTGGSGLTLGGPVGMIASFAMASAPTGWLVCDGSAVSRTVTYSALFAAISTTWGVGDGSSTFNVPDLEGVFLRGVGSQTFGGKTFSGTLAYESIDHMLSHKHTLSWATSATGGTPIYLRNDANAWRDTPVVTQSDMIGNAGDGPETYPANIGVKYCIKY
jgi:microcystin-dependent protein